ncbi:MAG: hypothetical protein L0Y72_08235 [Gemmataceae bacterium]|nr:hypothetical protein [Gemmataceae bacterium]MCI0739017.1 hypothetical protein [Gemmataceae bacterium]
MADALVRELNNIGYLPVFLPRTGIQPPELYNFDDRRLIRRGPLGDKVPEVAKLKPKKGKLPDILIKQKTKKNLTGALSFLKNALRCIGIADAPKLDLSFAGSGTLLFAFSNVHSLYVNPTKLENLLNALSTVGIPQEYVDSDALHIAYDYAYAASLLLSRGDQKEFVAGIKGKLGDFLDLGAEGKIQVVNKTTLAFSSSTRGQRAAFAYKAGRLFKRAGGWVLKPEVPMLSVGKSRTSTRPFLVARGVVLSVEMDEN